MLELANEIDTYDKTLNNMCVNDIKKWAELVLQKLREFADLDTDEFIVLAGNKYIKFLVPYMKNVEIPMKGMDIFKRSKWLKEKNANK